MGLWYCWASSPQGCAVFARAHATPREVKTRTPWPRMTSRLVPQRLHDVIAQCTEGGLTRQPTEKLRDRQSRRAGSPERARCKSPGRSPGIDNCVGPEALKGRATRGIARPFRASDRRFAASPGLCPGLLQRALSGLAIGAVLAHTALAFQCVSGAEKPTRNRLLEPQVFTCPRPTLPLRGRVKVLSTASLSNSLSGRASRPGSDRNRRTPRPWIRPVIASGASSAGPPVPAAPAAPRTARG